MHLDHERRHGHDDLDQALHMISLVDTKQTQTPVVAQLARLHLGCGLETPRGWINLDGSWNARFAKWPRIRRALSRAGVLPRGHAQIAWSPSIVTHDVRKPLPFGTETFDAVYASHLLEHLYLEEARRLLSECYRVLKPGGVLRMVVPDLHAIIREYTEGVRFGTEADAIPADTSADLLNHRLILRTPAPHGGGLLHRLYSAFTEFHLHKWMYDGDSLSHYFRESGFSEVSQRGFRESRIPGIEDVELPGRVLHGIGVCVEGIKPIA
jgi:predicted SAM-dependent methyltransferase